MEYEVLNLIDELDDIQLYAEMDVLNSLIDVYAKQAIMLEYTSDEVVQECCVVQEGAKWDKIKEDLNTGVKGAKGEKLIKKILLFMPRLIASMIKGIKSLIKNIKDKTSKKELNETVETIQNFSDEESNEFEKAIKQREFKIVDERDSPVQLIDLYHGLREGKVITQINHHYAEEVLIGYENYVKRVKLFIKDLCDPYNNDMSDYIFTRNYYKYMESIEQAKVFLYKSHLTDHMTLNKHDLNEYHQGLTHIYHQLENISEELISAYDCLNDVKTQAGEKVAYINYMKQTDWRDRPEFKPEDWDINEKAPTEDHDQVIRDLKSIMNGMKESYGEMLKFMKHIQKELQRLQELNKCVLEFSKHAKVRAREELSDKNVKLPSTDERFKMDKTKIRRKELDW